MPPRFCTTLFLLPFIAAAGQIRPAGAQDEVEPAEPPVAIEEESPLLVEPETPQDFFRAAMLMSDVGRPNLARRYLEGFAASNPDDETLLALRDQYGPGAFLQLAQTPELQPLSTNLLRRVNELLRRRDADPVRLDALLDALQGTPAQRSQALRTIENIGINVVPRILLRMGDPAAADAQASLVLALTRIGRDAVPLLIAALESPSPAVQAMAIEALGRIGDRRAVPWLWSPAYGTGQHEAVSSAARTALARLLEANADAAASVSPFGAADELTERALEHLRYEYPWAVEEDGLVIEWAWDPQVGTIRPTPLTPEAASLFAGARLARQALALSPESERAQAAYFALALGSQVDRGVPGAPLPTGPGSVFDLALSAGPEIMLDALRLALDSGNERAAVAALQVLAQVANRDVLHRSAGVDSPIVQALNFPDREVQFAAAVAILRVDPLQTFPHADRVVPVLARALNDTGSAVVVIIDPNVQRGSAIGGMLAETGLTAEIAATGRDGFLMAAERGDVELIAVQAYVVDWSLSQTIANLRADARTASIPIVIYGPEAVQGKLDPLRMRTQRVTVIVEPETPEFLKMQLRPLLASLSAPVATAQQQMARRSAAAYWLAYLAEGQRSQVFSLAPAEDDLMAAVREPALTADAILALGGIATQSAQEKLHGIATGVTFAPEARAAAAAQLAFHIQRFGLLLSDAQVVALKEAWSEADSTLATPLAAVIGSLKPNTRRVTQQIELSPPVVVPQP